MLHEFLKLNRTELIGRCRAKVRRRDSPPEILSGSEQGVPVFLDQLVDALHPDRPRPAFEAQTRAAFSSATPASRERRHSAALHGRQLLEQGYSVDQVVHGYGDLCQAVTELAGETNAPITVDEFHTFNSLLDHAIADAVLAYGSLRDSSGRDGDKELHERLGALADAQRVLIERALKALEVLKTGNLGIKGATGTVLEDSLLTLRDLVDKSLPELRLLSGMTSSPKA